MKSQTPLNGAGTFALKVNNIVVSSANFTENDEIVKLDLSAVVTSNAFAALFAPGATLTVNLALDAFTRNGGDYSVLYSMNHEYLDNNRTVATNTSVVRV